jgi:PAS domain S-box-containing protein
MKLSPSTDEENRYRSIFQLSGVSIWEEDISELRGALEALKERGVSNLKKYMEEHPEFIESAAGMIKVVNVNDYTLRLYEAGVKEELLGPLSTTLKLDQASSRSALMENILAIAEGRSYSQQEAVVRTLRGNLRTIIINASIPAEHSPYPLMIVNVFDVTERKREQENVGKAGRRYRDLMEQADYGILLLDPEGNFLLANTALCGMLGYTREELYRLNIIDTYPEDQREAGRERQIRIRTGEGKRFRFERLIRRKDGSVFPVEANAARLPDGNFQGILIDITERRKTEERLRNIARFPDENPNPVLRVSPDGTIMYANRSSNRLLSAWTVKEGEKIPAEYLPALSGAWATGEKQEMEVSVGKNTYAFTITPISGAGYINLYGKDVTEEKALAGKLLQAQKMEAIGRLAGGIAHDFNNILTVIRGYCDIVQEGIPPEDRLQADVAEIARAAEQATALTGQLLAFSRKQFLIPRVFNPNELVRSLEKMLTRVIGEDIRLRTLLDPAAGNIKGDPGQIEQVLMNLAVNARDAMPEGGKLTIETSNRTFDDAYAREHAEVKSGEYVRIAMSDTGHGMDKEVLSHIFEPFFTTKETGRGTGLGLSTAYGIVKQSGGHISCCSEPDKGTTFTLYLPRVFEASESTVHPAVETAPARGGETVLLVEDDQAVRGFTRAVLQKSGYTVIEAADGEQALAAVSSRDRGIALLLTDLVMPGMNGQELAGRIAETCAGVKVLYVSGYTGNAILNHGMLDSGLDFIQKPFSSRELLVKVREILARA